ncbi:MAG: hypothetical protein KAS17_10950 [Victivallaceae bacterium]|nr:hypothetical protein [Victivallaceae bacterium]
MKPAERKKLKGIVRRRHKKEAEEIYIIMFHYLIQIDRMIKKLIKDGHTKEEANEIIKRRIFES